MPRKPEQFSEASSLFLALNAAAQFIQMTAGTLDTCSHSAKAEILEATELLIDRVIAAQAENLEQKQHTPSERTSDNGEI